MYARSWTDEGVYTWIQSPIGGRKMHTDHQSCANQAASIHQRAYPSTHIARRDSHVRSLDMGTRRPILASDKGTACLTPPIDARMPASGLLCESRAPRPLPARRSHYTLSPLPYFVHPSVRPIRPPPTHTHLLPLARAHARPPPPTRPQDALGANLLTRLVCEDARAALVVT